MLHNKRESRWTSTQDVDKHSFSWQLRNNSICLDARPINDVQHWLYDDLRCISDNETTLGPPNSCKFSLTALVLTTDFLKDSKKTPRSKRKAIHIPLKKKTKDCRPTFRIKRLVNITCSSRQNFGQIGTPVKTPKKVLRGQVAKESHCKTR